MIQTSIANYLHEQELFQKLVTNEDGPNILMFQGESGSGKSRLIEYCLVQASNLPTARLKLENGGESIPNLFNLMGTKVGRQHLPIFSETIAELVGEPVEEKDALWQIKLRRHLREIGKISDLETRRERYQILTDAWFADALSFHQPMVLAVDTYEKSSSEFDGWFRDEFLYGVAQSAKMRVLVGGQSLPQTLEDWDAHAQLHEIKGVTDAEAWILWGEQQGLEIPSTEMMAGICLALKGNPSAIVETLESQFKSKVEERVADQTFYQQRRQLRQNLIEGFNLSDLKDICYDLEIDYEELPGHTQKKDFVRELIVYASRIGRLPELILICQQERPNYAW